MRGRDSRGGEGEQMPERRYVGHVSGVTFVSMIMTYRPPPIQLTQFE